MQLDGFILGKEGRVAQCFVDVFALEIRVIIQNGFSSLARRQQAK